MMDQEASELAKPVLPQFAPILVVPSLVVATVNDPFNPSFSANGAVGRSRSRGRGSRPQAFFVAGFLSGVVPGLR
jgi:hypothetical protein